jgi:hypothetical protein
MEARIGQRVLAAVEPQSTLALAAGRENPNCLTPYLQRRDARETNYLAVTRKNEVE